MVPMHEFKSRRDRLHFRCGSFKQMSLSLHLFFMKNEDYGADEIRDNAFIFDEAASRFGNKRLGSLYACLDSSPIKGVTPCHQTCDSVFESPSSLCTTSRKTDSHMSLSGRNFRSQIRRNFCDKVQSRNVFLFR